MKLLRYVLDAGGDVEIPAIGKPRVDFTSPADAVKAALDWEVTVTGQINNLMDIAVEEKDYIAQEFLRWFVNEQLEEISKMSTILNIIKRAGDNLLMAETYVTDALAEIETVEGGAAA
jgi:ferritin